MSKPTTRQSQMGVHMGSAPAVRLDTKQIDNMAFKVNVVAKTSDYTVKAIESGTFFTTYGATANINFTLPTMADGLVYWFFCAADFQLKVTGTSSYLIVHDDVAANTVAFEQGTELIGGMFQVFSDGTKWMATAYLEETQNLAFAS